MPPSPAPLKPAAPGVELAEEETLRVKFNEFDLNGDGSLDKQEIANLLRVCDRYTNDEAVEA